MCLEVIYILDPEIEFVCPIDYSRFPFHSYTCRLRLTSFNEYNTSIIFRTGTTSHWTVLLRLVHLHVEDCRDKSCDASSLMP